MLRILPTLGTFQRLRPARSSLHQSIIFHDMAQTPFTVGIIQDAVAGTSAETVDRAVTKIREAAARGAQIICLQEMFNSHYFCKKQSCERFDIAESIPGPVGR
jgi:hypothetical protein